MDNLINDKIDMFIMTSMKNHDTVRTETLRAIKTAFLNWKTAKENVGKTIDEGVEIQILNKMVKQRQESIEQFLQAGRTELADAEKAQISVIEGFLPKAATIDDIEKAYDVALLQSDYQPIKQNMGIFIKRIKEQLPNADGKMVADYVKSKLQ